MIQVGSKVIVKVVSNRRGTYTIGGTVEKASNVVFEPGQVGYLVSLDSGGHSWHTDDQLTVVEA